MVHLAEQGMAVLDRVPVVDLVPLVSAVLAGTAFLSTFAVTEFDPSRIAVLTTLSVTISLELIRMLWTALLCSRDDPSTG